MHSRLLGHPTKQNRFDLLPRLVFMMKNPRTTVPAFAREFDFSITF